MAESIGLMEGAFFVPKNEIIAWINSILHVNLTKIEQLGTGSVLCQLFDAYHPGEVQLCKVSWKARLEHEFILNFKVLQLAFNKLGISKNIDVRTSSFMIYQVDKLVKAKHQDNLEFAQWAKGYLETKFGKNLPKDYDALERREHVEPDFTFLEKAIPTKAALDYKNPIYHIDPTKLKASKTTDLTGYKSTAKKMALNGMSGHSNFFERNNKENQGFESIQAIERLKAEKEVLQDKLRKIEMLVNVPDKSERQIIKSIRDFFGHQANVLSKRSLSEMKADDDPHEDLGFLEGEEERKYILLLDGESI